MNEPSDLTASLFVSLAFYFEPALLTAAATHTSTKSTIKIQDAVIGIGV